MKNKEKTKQNKNNTKNNPTTKQKKQKQSKRKQKTQKQNLNKENKSKKHKYTETFQTQINKNMPPHKAPQTGGKNKQTLFNTFATLPDTQKTNHNNLKKQKTPFCQVQKQPTISHRFSVLFNIQFFIAIAVLC